MNRAKIIALSAIASFGLSACSNSDVDESAIEAEKTPAKNAPAVIGAKPESSYDGSVAKPGSPFGITYRIIGTPIVGSPVTVELQVESKLGARPITVDYRINDASSMMLHEAQPARVLIAPAADENSVVQRVTVVPQREGRIYLNVSASYETDEGSASAIMAVPIQVGAGGRELQENGEVQLDEDGEAVRVLSGD